jgi:hypothetical protein
LELLRTQFYQPELEANLFEISLAQIEGGVIRNAMSKYHDVVVVAFSFLYFVADEHWNKKDKN